mmetsp:Transcript_2135/g.8326  ORF Transcript_2135/g.8326 Transcript_2135/m.8326 type:complete len:310 (+) Transcript_2135:326-1255(+)
MSGNSFWMRSRNMMLAILVMPVSIRVRSSSMSSRPIASSTRAVTDAFTRSSSGKLMMSVGIFGTTGAAAPSAGASLGPPSSPTSPASAPAAAVATPAAIGNAGPPVELNLASKSMASTSPTRSSALRNSCRASLQDMIARSPRFSTKWMLAFSRIVAASPLKSPACLNKGTASPVLSRAASSSPFVACARARACSAEAVNKGSSPTCGASWTASLAVRRTLSLPRPSKKAFEVLLRPRLPSISINVQICATNTSNPTSLASSPVVLTNALAPSAAAKASGYSSLAMCTLAMKCMQLASPRASPSSLSKD